MKWVFCLTAIILWGEFNREVQGKKTLVGCYLRGFYGIEDGRCD